MPATGGANADGVVATDTVADGLDEVFSIVASNSAAADCGASAGVATDGCKMGTGGMGCTGGTYVCEVVRGLELRDGSLRDCKLTLYSTISSSKRLRLMEREELKKWKTM